MQIETQPVSDNSNRQPPPGPLTSVVIPAFNASRFLAATIKTALDQTIPPGEIIVVDDGSTDDTVAIARSFAGVGVKVISLANSGPAAARNAGTHAATGEYIAYLDADDLWPADKLATQLAALASVPGPAFSFTDYRMFDEHGFRKRKSQLLRHASFRRVARQTATRELVVIKDRGTEPVLYDTSYIAPSSVLARRADILAAGGFDETLRYCEDYELFLRLFARLTAVVVMRPLLFYRQHAGQGTSKTATRMKAGHFDVARLAAATPENYPRGDVKYLARTNFLRHFRMGILHARLGQFEEAVRQLESSLAARWTVRASVALIAARACESGIGRRLFDTLRALWKARPGRR